VIEFGLTQDNCINSKRMW